MAPLQFLVIFITLSVPGLRGKKTSPESIVKINIFRRGNRWKKKTLIMLDVE